MSEASRDKEPARKGISRRAVLKSAVAFPILRSIVNSTPKKHVAVIGAGAFGGWTALYLLRSGVRVTLVDAWGPGNSRASSGGETRVIRGTYGADAVYTRMVARALQLWRENESRWACKLYHQTGVLWMAPKDDSYEKAALPILRDAGLKFEQLSINEAQRRFPQINFDHVNWAIYERDAGYLHARRACQIVLEGFISEGGQYIQTAVRPGSIDAQAMRSLKTSGGSSIEADQYVFACGPWLSELFPEVIGDKIIPTRQEVFFFGAPAGDLLFNEEKMPVWIDHGASFIYGIPGNERRGFKIADDTRGTRFDPTNGDRTPSAAGIKAARDYIAFRFPRLKDAPLLESRVCQYENSPDTNLIIDRHPHAENVWFVGGGSGHGFKHGPAVGERAAKLVLGTEAIDPHFSLVRFAKR